MKELEEIAPSCSEYDDVETERDEIIANQGLALPIVGAMNPDTLDEMDGYLHWTTCSELRTALMSIIHILINLL